MKIVKEDATPEEIDQVMKSAGGTGAMFKSAILKSANNEVMEAYSQAADQYQDVLKLEESMQELHQVGLSRDFEDGNSHAIFISHPSQNTVSYNWTYS